MTVAERKILSIIKDRPYFIRDNFVLYNGDAIHILNELPETSIDMIFADPPYNLSNGGFTVHAGRMVSVNKGDCDKSKGLRDDYNLISSLFTASHETLLWARKEKKAKHTFNYDLMKNGNWSGDSLKKTGLQMRSVWSVGTPKPLEKKFGKHPTQKPVDLLQRIVLASTKKGDTIMDPFTGSSTTGIAAYFHDRNFIGIDTEQKFLDLSIKRFEELKNSLSLKNKSQS